MVSLKLFVTFRQSFRKIVVMGICGFAFSNAPAAPRSGCVTENRSAVVGQCEARCTYTTVEPITGTTHNHHLSIFGNSRETPQAN